MTETPPQYTCDEITWLLLKITYCQYTWVEIAVKESTVGTMSAKEVIDRPGGIETVFYIDTTLSLFSEILLFFSKRNDFVLLEKLRHKTTKLLDSHKSSINFSDHQLLGDSLKLELLDASGIDLIAEFTTVRSHILELVKKFDPAAWKVLLEQLNRLMSASPRWNKYKIHPPSPKTP